jgi:murein DD-endopeptidase MepM/ murein hydrolase activator NlpD
MNDEQLEHHALLMRSRGNRQFVGNPFDFDVMPYITSWFGYRVNPISGSREFHRGLDIGLPEGTEIRAGFDGIVIAADFCSGYGYYVIIERVMDDGTVIQAKYAHCHTLLVTVGQEVREGHIIATVGNTGSSTGAHLHVEVIKNNVRMNPAIYMVTHAN